MALITGAKQFVLQEAIEMMLCLLLSYTLLLRLINIIASGCFVGADITFFQTMEYDNIT